MAENCYRLAVSSQKKLPDILRVRVENSGSELRIKV